MEEQLPPSGPLWLSHRITFLSLKPGWWVAKVSSSFYFLLLMFGRRGQHVTSVTSETGRATKCMAEVRG